MFRDLAALGTKDSRCWSQKWVARRGNRTGRGHRFHNRFIVLPDRSKRPTLRIPAAAGRSVVGARPRRRLQSARSRAPRRTLCPGKPTHIRSTRPHHRIRGPGASDRHVRSQSIVCFPPQRERRFLAENSHSNWDTNPFPESCSDPFLLGRYFNGASALPGSGNPAVLSTIAISV